MKSILQSCRRHFLDLKKKRRTKTTQNQNHSACCSSFKTFNTRISCFCYVFFHSFLFSVVFDIKCWTEALLYWLLWLNIIKLIRNNNDLRVIHLPIYVTSWWSCTEKFFETVIKSSWSLIRKFEWDLIWSLVNREIRWETSICASIHASSVRERKRESTGKVTDDSSYAIRWRLIE